MSIQHTREYEFIFSLNKQSDIATAIATGNIQYQRTIRDFQPFVEEHPAVVSDRQWYGKGHSHPTFRDRLQKVKTLNGASRSATSIETLQATSLVMGNVQSTQADSVSNPNEYTKTLTWQDLSTNKEVIYTSFIEIMGGEYTHIHSGAWLNSVTLTGNREDHVILSFDGGARKTDDVVKSGPGQTEAGIFRTLHGRVKFGAADSPAYIDAEVLSWTLTISQNPDLYWLMGNSAGEKDILSKVLIGDQTVTGNFVIFINKTHLDRFRDQDTVELWIECGSGETIDSNEHYLTIKIPNLKISSESFSEEGSTVALTLGFDEDSVLKAGSDEHLELEFVTDIDDSELLVAA